MYNFWPNLTSYVIINVENLPEVKKQKKLS